MPISPLDALLYHLARDKVHTLGELAAKLDVSEGLLEQMLGILERADYVHVTERAFCDQSCRGCDMVEHCAKGCLSTRLGRMWSLTEKGLRAAQRQETRRWADSR